MGMTDRQFAEKLDAWITREPDYYYDDGDEDEEEHEKENRETEEE